MTRRPALVELEAEAIYVLRECAAAREAVAMMDASTLGKIDVQGPDAAEFLNRLYTNAMDTLRVGRGRYFLMCRADGMVFDDGVALRLADDRFLTTTTTGNAAPIPANTMTSPNTHRNRVVCGLKYSRMRRNSSRSVYCRSYFSSFNPAKKPISSLSITDSASRDVGI